MISQLAILFLRFQNIVPDIFIETICFAEHKVLLLFHMPLTFKRNQKSQSTPAFYNVSSHDTDFYTDYTLLS